MSSRPVKADDGPAERRSYRSPERERRARETRARIVGAAESLFLADGYSATTIRAVAGKAGVAEQTVYLVFKNKAALLDAVIDAAISGPAGASWRKQLEAALTCSPARLLREFAHASARVMERTAHILAVAEAAATTDPELSELRERGYQTMRAQFARVAKALHTSEALASSTSERDAAATIYALANEAVFLRLTDGFGWTAADYGKWLADILIATLIKPPA